MKHWHTMKATEAVAALRTDARTGLGEREALTRQAEHGRNTFEKPKRKLLGLEILRQLGDISTIILLLAAALSFCLALRDGEGFLEPFVVLSIVALNVTLAVTQERSAEKALEALMRLNAPTCTVLRGGEKQQTDAAELVPGDIVLLNLGDMVPADARLIESVELTVDESSLTGESEPAEKDANTTAEENAPLGDRRNMVFSGCHVTAGRGTAVVVATGMGTQMGHIAGYLNNIQKAKTPLQRRLAQVAAVISRIAIAAALFLLVTGILQGESVWEMVTLAATLAVAAVPETLNLIVTLSLAHGVRGMVRRHALIRKLSAVETLGSTSVICSDKTGTLTQNRMSVRRLWAPGEAPAEADTPLSPALRDLLLRFALASTATAQPGENGETRFWGSPTEIALLRLAEEQGLSRADALRQSPAAAEIPFSSARKRMTVVLKDPAGGYTVLTKGALDRLSFTRESAAALRGAHETHAAFARDALRVLGLGTRHLDTLPPRGRLEEAEQDLTFCGLVGLIDPPRPEAAQAVAQAKSAGIRTVMITGDHADTAAAIARDIGILEEGGETITGAELQRMPDETLHKNVRRYSVYARVSPEDKIRIVQAWQAAGEVVSMTGDGVNDTPALKAADVGVAMGRGGTEVAKSASDMVLTDDNFATILSAVAEGRNVYSNIRKTIYFLLVCNLSEIVIMLAAQLAGWGMPVTPVLLLLVNVLGDGIPGLHLARETSDPRLMTRTPIRRTESFLSGGLLYVIIRQTAACAAAVLAGFFIGRFVPLPGTAASLAVGQSLAFLVLGWTSILHLFNVRSRVSMFRRTVRDNLPLLWSALAMMGIFALLVAVPPLGRVFGLTPIGWMHWLAAAGLSLFPTVTAETGKWFKHLAQARETHIQA